jgi:hypothetical protein
MLLGGGISVDVLSRAINFGRQCHFKIWLDCHKFKKFVSVKKMRKK